ncbi:MAG: FliM/FliN family flagellar motor switch protein [Pseudomonadota bacterium]
MNSGDVLKQKIRAADGRKPDPTVMAFADNLTSQIVEALALEPKFTLSPKFHDAEIASFKAFLASVPEKSLFAYTSDVLFHLENPLAYCWVEKGLSGESEISKDDVAEFVPSAIDASISRPFFDCLLTALQRDLPRKYRLTEHQYDEAMHVERLADNVYFCDETSKVVVFKYIFGDYEPQTEYIGRIVLPLSIVEEIVISVEPRESIEAPHSGLWTKHMKEEVLSLPLDLSAVIERTSMSVNEISRLAPGKHILIPRDSLDKLLIGVETIKGLKPLATGRLGSNNQLKAVKLNDLSTAKLTTLLNSHEHTP